MLELAAVILVAMAAHNLLGVPILVVVADLVLRLLVQEQNSEVAQVVVVQKDLVV